MYQKKGYLNEEYKIFKIKDYCDRTFDFHYHDFYKIIIFINGKVVINIEGKNYDLKPMDIVLVPVNEIHRPVVDPLVEYERIVLYLSRSFLNRDKRLLECFRVSEENHTNVMRLSGEDYSKVLRLLEQALQKEKGSDFLGDLYSETYLTESLLLINESAHDNGLLFDGSVSYDRKIVEICEYICDNLSKELSVEALCDKFFISRYYFMRKFKEYTGLTVHKFILEKRILYTNVLVESGEKITTACVKAGFKDYSTYLRAKKRMTDRLVKSFDQE